MSLEGFTRDPSPKLCGNFGLRGFRDTMVSLLDSSPIIPTDRKIQRARQERLAKKAAEKDATDLPRKRRFFGVEGSLGVSGLGFRV